MSLKRKPAPDKFGAGFDFSSGSVGLAQPTRSAGCSRRLEIVQSPWSGLRPCASGPDTILPSNGGKSCPARLPVKQTDDEREHDRTPLFDQSHWSKSWFQAGFVVTGKWFRRRGRPHPRSSRGLMHVNNLPVARRMIFFGARSSGLPASKFARVYGSRSADHVSKDIYRFDGDFGCQLVCAK